MEKIGGAGIGEPVHVVEGLIGARHRDLFRNDQRAATGFKNLPQRHQAGQTAIRLRRRRCNGKNPTLEGRIGRVAALAHARDPVDRILQERRDRRRIIRAGDEDAVMRCDHSLQFDRRLGLPVSRVDIGVVDRQRIIGERNAGDIHVEQRQFLGRQRRQARIMRTDAGRSRQDENFRCRHRRLRKARGISHAALAAVIVENTAF